MGMTLDKPPSASNEPAERLNFDYIKVAHFRTIRPDGAVGVLTPNGLPSLAFYNERQAIPQRIVYSLNDDGTVGDEIDRVGRDAIVREIEIAVTLDVATAQALMSFLGELIEKALKMNGSET